MLQNPSKHQVLLYRLAVKRLRSRGPAQQQAPATDTYRANAKCILLLLYFDVLLDALVVGSLPQRNTH